MSNVKNNISTSNLLSEALNVMDVITTVGLEDMADSVEGWKMHLAGYAQSENGYAARGHGKAEWEVIIEHESGVSVILRNYGNGQHIARWAIHSDENVGRERAMAHITNHYCQKAAVAEVVEGVSAKLDDRTYADWDELRRERFDCFNPSYDHVEVVHNDYESCVYFGKTGGRVVASWSQAEGYGTVKTIEELANDLASDVRNYIINAAND